jgi:hypothetical protein
MIPREKVQELVQAHARIEDPTTDAIWIKPDATEVWLVEVIPSMSDDEHAEEPLYFNPGAGFRFPLALLPGNRASLEDALRRDRELAKAVAAGEVMLDNSGTASHLVAVARELAAAA